MMHSGRLKLAIFAMAILSFAAVAYAENIDPYEDDSQYAYGENIGWLNFEPNLAEPNVGAMVSNEKLTGFIWAENIGWINLSPASYGGVLNDGGGNLYGYAWGENVGWLNFDPNVPGDTNHYGVTIDSEGNFDGWAWGENIGWIHFQSTSPVAYKVMVCKVDFEDIRNFVEWWLVIGPALPADLADNNDVEFTDYTILAGYWRDYCPDDWQLSVHVPLRNLLFSEYVEGSSWNKAVEIYNAGYIDVNLGSCQVKAYHNGSATPTYTIDLDAVTLAPGDVFVLANPNIDDTNDCDQLNSGIQFNGDDAVELVYNGLTLDVIGQIGYDPGSYWGSDPNTTQDHTLRRKCSVTSGDPDGSDAFDPSIEWNSFDLNTLDGLGSHCQ